MTSASPAALSARPRRPGFSLVELLVVMIVIALVIAIIVPSLGAVRDTARNTGTKSLINNIVQASGQFQNDERRLPGYFSAKEMGDQDNESRGMSAMENLIIDLMGVKIGTSSGSGMIEVGPTSGNTVFLDPGTLGATGTGMKNYLQLDGKYLVAQTVPDQQAGNGPDEMPDVVDYFGTPLLAWVADETAVGEIEEAEDFARDNSDSGTARFYWASNAAFLKAAPGKMAKDQRFSTNSGSVIGDGASDIPESMMALFGNPSYPRRDPANPNQTPTVAAAARGPLIVQSAGRDGYYFGVRDNGARMFGGAPLKYEKLFTNNEPEDLVQRFDDTIIAGGN